MPETGTHDTYLVMKPLHVASAQEPPSSPLRRNHYPILVCSQHFTLLAHSVPLDSKLASKPPDRVNLQAVLGEL